MRLKPVASVVLSCLGFSGTYAFADDVMVVTASGYEKRSPTRLPACRLFLNKNYKPINIMT